MTHPPEELKEQISRHEMEELGFALIGVVKSETFRLHPPVVGSFGREAVFPHPDEVFPQCRSVIVVAMKTRDDIYDTILYRERLFAGVYDEIIHHRLYKLCHFVEDLGFGARLGEKISYKRAAVLAGIGHVGKNTLITRTDVGSNIRLGVVLTDADLPADESNDPFAKTVCGSCQRCIEACPAGAVTPYSVDFSVCAIPKLFDASDEQAREWARGLHKHVSTEAVIECNLCQKACPYNQ